MFAAGSITENKMNRPSNVIKSLVRGVGGLSPSCKEAVRLQSAALDRSLVTHEKFGLRVHLLLCKWCRAYGKQIKILHLAAKEQSRDDRLVSSEALPPGARERIKRTLQSNRDAR
jgi:hypothetical protein